jgi:hypothetical protein
VVVAILASNLGSRSYALADRRGEATRLKRDARLVKPGFET